MPLVTLQKRTLRIMLGCSYGFHTAAIFRQLKIFTTNDIHILEVAKFMHCIHHKQNNTVSDSFKLTTSNRQPNARYSKSKNYCIQSTNLALDGRKALNITGPEIWAKVPPKIKKYSLKTFAAKLKEHLISKYQI